MACDVIILLGHSAKCLALSGVREQEQTRRKLNSETLQEPHSVVGRTGREQRKRRRLRGREEATSVIFHLVPIVSIVVLGCVCVCVCIHLIVRESL